MPRDSRHEIAGRRFAEPVIVESPCILRKPDGYGSPLGLHSFASSLARTFQRSRIENLDLQLDCADGTRKMNKDGVGKNE